MNADTSYQVLVREIRKARGLTQEQLARELDVTFGTVNAWENGRHRPMPLLARRLADMATEAGVNLQALSSALSPVTGQRTRKRRGKRS